MTTGVLVKDNFTDDRPCGKVIGRENPQGVVRRGVDVERVIGIDHNALRIQPLVKPGWGRSVLAYGPYPRQNGLAFAVCLSNGHNTSQTGTLMQSLPRRIGRWARGSETETIGARLVGWARAGHKRSFARQLLRWAREAWDHRKPGAAEIDENLALGWFPSEAPAHPATEGNGFIVHASGAENGELWARVGTAHLPVIGGLQNIPIFYLIILRENGAAYYVSSLSHAHAMPAYPLVRPVAIDPWNQDRSVYAGVSQSVLGQIGFRVDTRVYGIQVEELSQYSHWYGTAHAADRMGGNGLLDGTPAEMGGIWKVTRGAFERTLIGARPTHKDNLAEIDPGHPSGLIHLLLEPSLTSNSQVNLLWRMKDSKNFWCFHLDPDGCSLLITEEGVQTEIAASTVWSLHPEQSNSIQILDDGKTFTLALNGQFVFQKWFLDSRLETFSGLGILVPDAQDDLHIHSFEAHPRTLPFPASAELAWPAVSSGKRVAIQDNFHGPVGELNTKRSDVGNKMWRREIGSGTIELTEDGSARVKATVQTPNPGRTAYTIEWDDPDFADVQVDLHPPGTGRGQGEKGRGGIIFWQDPGNYFIVSTWLDDNYDGTSISSFFYLHGFEELYDAVWTNVGRRVVWGVPYTLRVIFDGMLYNAYVNDEPVLYRSLSDVYPDITRLQIRRVGIVANWEWGNDTGSAFRCFLGRRKE